MQSINMVDIVKYPMDISVVEHMNSNDIECGENIKLNDITHSMDGCVS
jgi:hypothetical protein